MNDAALHLTEQVFPEVPVRQWVCSLPWQLRYVLGFDRVLCAAVLRAWSMELSKSYRLEAVAEKRGAAIASVGAEFASLFAGLVADCAYTMRGRSAAEVRDRFHRSATAAGVAPAGMYGSSGGGGSLSQSGFRPRRNPRNTGVFLRFLPRARSL